jgi:hypothetical protein
VGLPKTEVERQWQEWNPGVPLRILHTEYASIVQPILRFVDELRARKDCQVVVLIPVLIPERLRYRPLHNQLDLALSSALHHRPDVVVARVPMLATAPEHPEHPEHPTAPEHPEQPRPDS